MADLPTNLKDDILDSSVNTRRKYRMIENGDGTVEFEDVTEYSQVGDEYGAGLINETNKQVNAKVEKAVIVRDLETIGAITEEGYIPDALALKDVNNSLGGLQFGYDSASGKYGYWKKEADTEVFVPFSSADLEKAYSFSKSDMGANPSLTFSGIEKGEYIAFAFTRQVYSTLHISSFGVDYEKLGSYEFYLDSGGQGFYASVYKISVPESGNLIVNCENTNSTRPNNLYMDLFTL